MENRGDSCGRNKIRRQESDGSVDVDPGYLEHKKEVDMEVQGAQGLIKKCRESLPPLSRLTRGLRKKYN